ncbi:DUF1697 domain-containing protein [Streptomyces sp. CA-253872]|uniref:DUF1697 domain-containing protein n=1 Tax=Streptomyces sp. CA-253872 TaxID=3240067 RepID=UPI003D8FF04F
MTSASIALLRGVNVGTAHKVPMARLRELAAGLGHRAVRTHLNSGNIVFVPGVPRPPEEHAAELAALLEREFGFAVPVLVLDTVRLRAALAANPYPEGTFHASRLQLVFLSGPADPARFADLDPAAHAPDDYRIGDRVLYLHTPDGISRSTLATELLRPARLPGLFTTTRTWNTANKLLALAERAEEDAGP